MFRTLGNTLSLLAGSWRVLQRDGLLAFPVASGAALLLVLIYVLVAFEYGGTFSRIAGGFRVLPADVVFLGIAYLAAWFVTLYFCAALVSALHYRMEGGTPDSRLGLEAANDRLGGIGLWSVFAASGGIIVRQLTARGGYPGRAGRVVADRLHAWALPLVLPVMMVEGSSPAEAMRRSTEISRETWGRQMAANYDMGIVYAACCLVALVPGAALFAAGVAPAVAVMVVLTLVASLTALAKALDTVLSVVLFQYATLGEVAAEFADHHLRNAFVHRQARGPFERQATVRRASRPHPGNLAAGRRP